MDHKEIHRAVKDIRAMFSDMGEDRDGWVEEMECLNKMKACLKTMKEKVSPEKQPKKWNDIERYIREIDGVIRTIVQSELKKKEERIQWRRRKERERLEEAHKKDLHQNRVRCRKALDAKKCKAVSQNQVS